MKERNQSRFKNFDINVEMKKGNGKCKDVEILLGNKNKKTSLELLLFVPQVDCRVFI